MAYGTLTLAFQTGFALPVEEATYTVKNTSGVTVASGNITRGSSGLSEPITLPAPERALSLIPDSPEAPYSTYTVETSAAGYYNTIIRGVQIFADTGARQPVDLLPLPRSGVARGPLVYQIPPHALRLNYTPAVDYSTARVLDRVVVPEMITVHLGSPNSFAQNVTVPFIDYIKNVASSEIYPTWPEASLRANILAQISLALNRVYTEWYPARGYSFNITNSTAYDQYYVYGRDIFDSVSRIADELFATYIIKPGREEPFYAEYCNGSTVSCPGMSQWGTVSLAQDGFTPEQILEFYYGDISLVTTDNIEEIPDSYPGAPLTLGSRGNDVLTMQIQLDRIAINYPAIPLVFADGVFGPNTQAAVRAFQRIANLSADGVVGRATWYAISHYYVAVKKLAELASEGELPQYNDFAFPGILRRGSRGTSVQTVQFFLNTLSAYNPSIPTQRIDGIYGQTTENAVRDLQRFYNLTVDGVVGQQTWNLLVDAYRGIQNVPIEPEEIVTRPYPGSLVRRGQSNANVRYVQNLLSAISDTFVQIPSLRVDGVFGAGTESAVRTFQRIFGLSADGIVGPSTWNRLNEVYVADTTCLFSSDQSALTRPYPGSLVRRGQSNANVRYVQTALNAIRRAIPSIPALSTDGVFGAGTERAVIAFQQIFGLVDDGIVGATTWRELNFLYVATTSGCLSNSAVALTANTTESPATLAASAAPVQKAEARTEAPVGKVNSHPDCKKPAYCSVCEGVYPAKTLRVGSFGPLVWRAKEALAEKLAQPLSCFGENLLFGLSMRRGVERFQAMMGLPVSGELDRATFAKLFEEKPF